MIATRVDAEDSPSMTEKHDVEGGPRSAPGAEVLRSFWDTHLEGIAITGSDGIIRHANAAFHELFGHGDQTIGMSLRRIHLTESDWERSQATLRGDQSAWEGPLRLARADGRVLHAHVVLSRLHTGATEPPMLAMTVSDAAGRMERDTEFQAMRARMAGNLSVTPLAVVDWDVEGRIIHWNGSSERIFGWREEEVLGKPFLPLIVPGLAHDQVKGVVSALLDGQFANSRNLNVTKGGRSITCQWYNALLHNEHGEVVAVMSQAADVTAEERAEQALRESQRLLSAIVDNSPSHLSVKDTEGRYLLFNRALEQLHGKSRADVLGKSERDLWPEEVAASRVAAHEQVIATGKPVEREESIGGAEDRRTLAVIDFPVYDEAGAISGVCSIATDITFRKDAEEERAALQQEIISAQQTALRELSSPLIPLAKGVLVMPLVGLVDEQRTRRMMETLLSGITGQQAHTAIIDITGVRSVDLEVANALLVIARAARLLGAEVILTGISPVVAQSLIKVGTDMRGIVTLGTLEAGIAHALKKRFPR
jgi:rsbT co-antagonist protein RsbR